MVVAIIPPLDLTQREYEVALLVIDGMSNKAIATALGINLQTVKNHLQSTFRSLGISSRTELALKVWWEIEGKDKD